MNGQGTTDQTSGPVLIGVVHSTYRDLSTGIITMHAHKRYSYVDPEDGPGEFCVTIGQVASFPSLHHAGQQPRGSGPHYPTGMGTMQSVGWQGAGQQVHQQGMQGMGSGQTVCVEH